MIILQISVIIPKLQNADIVRKPQILIPQVATENVFQCLENTKV